MPSPIKKFWNFLTKPRCIKHGSQHPYKAGLGWKERWECQVCLKELLKNGATYTTQDATDYDTRIGMLRQWLNEDRITDTSKMVTNEDIRYWLHPKDECKECFAIGYHHQRCSKRRIN